MKIRIKIISQLFLANPSQLPSGNVKLKTYFDGDVNLPVPLGGRDYLVCLTSWNSTYARILQKDPSAIMRIMPYVEEQNLPF